MNKKEILSKLHGKDYNNELEKVLETKDFSEDVKNLLLSMLYKIEIAYSDYETIKVNVENKTKYLEKIIEIVKQCSSIEIVLPKSEKDYELVVQQKIKFVKDDLLKKIVTFPNERIMLYALYELDNIVIYLDEKYNLIRVGFSELINEGRNINNIEVIRDFNAWSWNIQVNEISNLQYNLIYQNLQILLGYEKFNNWLLGKNIDYIETLKSMLEQLYGQVHSNFLIRMLSKLSIILCVNHNQNERARLLSEKEIFENELYKLMDISKLTEDTFKKKKQILKEVKKIDGLLNDKNLLIDEYIRRNEKLPEYHKIFSLSHLTDILTTERKKLMKQIEESNKLVEPSNYVEAKRKCVANLELLKGINLENDVNTNFFPYLIQLQKGFLNCFQIKIQKAITRKEIMDLCYEFRYYGQLPYSKNIRVRKVEELKPKIINIQDLLLKKLYELKIINKISNDTELNNFIIQKVLESKIVKLENIFIESKIRKEELKILLYDGEILEDTYKLEKKSKLKISKKIKLFS